MKVSLYLSFDGNCAEAFDFYKRVFGGDIDCKMTWAENPEKEKAELSEADGKKIMHMGLPLTNGTDLMGCDNPPAGNGCSNMEHEKYTVGNNIQISLQPDSKDQADKLIRALSSEGGKITMPMSETFWAYFGMCKDPYGVTWMFNVMAEDEKKKEQA